MRSIAAEAKIIEDRAHEKGYMSDEEFATLIRELLISEGGWVIDTGSVENVNKEVILRLIERVKRHPK